MAVHNPFTVFMSAVGDVFLSHKSLLASMTIISPTVAEYFAFQIGTITGSCHTILPKCSKNNKNVVENLSVTNFNNATVGMKIKEASWYNIMNALSMWYYRVTGV